MDTEIPARRRFDAIQTVAEVHLVEIQLEDLLFRELTLDAGGENRFLQLAAIRLVARKEALPRELLGNGAAAFGAAPFAHVAERSRSDADEVDAGVIEEALIFDGQRP